MQASNLQTEIAANPANLEAIADKVARQPKLLPEVFDGLRAEKARIKFGCLKLLRIISEKKPALLYHDIERVFALLDSENNILKWGAIIVVGNLAKVDHEGKMDKILDQFLKPISGHVMITAANVIGAAGKIALAKPKLADRIARALLRVERANYQTAECRNVALGHAVAALDLCFDHLERPEPIVHFVERQLHNRRPVVQRKATKFLKTHAQDAKETSGEQKPFNRNDSV